MLSITDGLALNLDVATQNLRWGRHSKMGGTMLLPVLQLRGLRHLSLTFRPAVVLLVGAEPLTRVLKLQPGCQTSCPGCSVGCRGLNSLVAGSATSAPPCTLDAVLLDSAAMT